MRGRLASASADALAGEAGMTADELRPGLEEMGATIDAMIRRFLVVATAT